MRYGMLIDLNDCIGCEACVTSCKQQWGSGPGAARSWVHTLESGSRGKDLAVALYPGVCMQCEAHPCTTDCPSGATYVNANGVIVVDQDLCIGCGNCVSSCPYGARHVDDAKGIVEKCNLCAPLVARGEQPACVATCLAECRTFGDLDDPNGDLVRLVHAKGAKPLVTKEVDTRPHVFYAGDRQREQIAASGAVRKPRSTWLTAIWTSTTRPLASSVVPFAPVLALAGGTVVNFIGRRQRVAEEEAQIEAQAEAKPVVIPRHRGGMRFLHWFNALSWILLLTTGTALMSGKKFALFGQSLPRHVASIFGGAPEMLRFHVLWGLLWAVVIIPLFLLYKRGGREAIEEIRLRRDDLVWLARKPLAMLGLGRQPLPPQDKYNAGQKIFAITALAGTATIIATGLVMALHLGGANVIATAILLHKLAIAFAILGVSVHITMAAIIREERPALRSMVTGKIERAHAETHNARWVEEHEKKKREGDKK